MFGLATILSASLSLLLAAQSVIATPNPVSPNTRSLILSVRADSDPTIAKECESQCAKLEDSLTRLDTPEAACTNDVMSQFESCFDCEAKAGAATIATLQDSVNSFAETCSDFDHPVKNVTIAAKNAGERLSVGLVAPVVVGLFTLSLAL
ncbi:hypothetical protein C8R43DRAFT_1237105 [Mycena crocata]|nr:hypothetical protein C8R43DRAFT_1237105 [Mycena crocata]